METSIGILAIIFLLAFLVETLVEFSFGDLFDKFPKISPYKWTLKYIAIAVGLVGTFHYNIDIMQIAGKVLSVDPPILSSWYGTAITGIAVGKGSNYVHQFIVKFFPVK